MADVGFNNHYYINAECSEFVKYKLDYQRKKNFSFFFEGGGIMCILQCAYLFKQFTVLNLVPFEELMAISTS